MSRLARICLLLVCCLSLGGCAKSQAAPPKVENFSCSFVATYRDMRVSGTMVRTTPGTLTLDFSEPETLRDVRASWDGESVNLSYLGLSFPLDDATIPEAALGKQLIAALDNARNTEGTADGKAVTITGAVGEVPYRYRYAVDTGFPLSLSVPALPLEVTFTAVTTQE